MFKKIFSCLCLACLLVAAANAGMLTDNKIMSQTLAQGNFEFDARVSYSSASEMTSMVASDPAWISISDAGLDYVTLVEIPVNLTYGVSDNISLRVTLPYASLDMKSTSGINTKGNGLANVEFAGLWSIFQETEAAPSVSALLDVKLGAGKKLSELVANEFYVGRRSTEIVLAGVVQKDFALLNSKVLVGYNYTNPYKEDLTGVNEFDVNVPDKLVYSIALSSPITSFVSLSGEFWGTHALGKETWSVNGTSIDIPKSERASVVFTPTATVNIFEGLKINGAADLVLSKTAASTIDIYDAMKYNTYTLWGTYNI